MGVGFRQTTPIDVEKTWTPYRMPRTRKYQLKGGQRYLALDCEMIQGTKGSMLAEVGIVDWNGDVVYHTYVAPTRPVVDYRTAISGVKPEDVTEAAGAMPFLTVQRDVAQLLRNAILVGHALENDLRALGLRAAIVRNTAHHPFFQTMGARGQLQPQKLATLYAQHVGNQEIQQGAHGAIEDARAAMRLYRVRHAAWNEPVAHSGPVLAPRPPFLPKTAVARNNSSAYS